MNKNIIIPDVTLIVDTTAHLKIPILIIDNTDILYIDCLAYIFCESQYDIRKQLITKLKELVQEYKVNTILLQQNKLFTDTFTIHPDPYVLSNITLSYGIKIAIEDNFYSEVTNILEIPQKDWERQVLRGVPENTIDRYKSHIEVRSFNSNTIQQIEDCNAYRAICFSESILYNTLMNKKYLINKGVNNEEK